ncbi:PREDICTED: uncharacterized protein LOC106816686 [Priapulus caudatus]|uniref:Uncharacterized protein LOC106816686 n=1 Tax=Priapulus caudatus TaxID=37621 RepID=A0ABM1EX72_PRICU|nr:PREDICTED: uncharacterized protein LOC106816686 [Priapulus caudatus]
MTNSGDRFQVGIDKVIQERGGKHYKNRSTQVSMSCCRCKWNGLDIVANSTVHSEFTNTFQRENRKNLSSSTDGRSMQVSGCKSMSCEPVYNRKKRNALQEDNPVPGLENCIVDTPPNLARQECDDSEIPEKALSSGEGCAGYLKTNTTDPGFQRKRGRRHKRSRVKKQNQDLPDKQETDPVDSASAAPTQVEEDDDDVDDDGGFAKVQRYIASVLRSRGSLTSVQLHGHANHRFGRTICEKHCRNPAEMLKLAEAMRGVRIHDGNISLAPRGKKPQGRGDTPKNTPTGESTATSLCPEKCDDSGCVLEGATRTTDSPRTVTSKSLNKAPDWCQVASVASGEEIADGTTAQKPVIVTRLGAARAAVAELEKEKVLAVDAEGLNLRVECMMTLLQIGTLDGRVFLFDIQANKDLVMKSSLSSILSSQDTVKIFHDCRCDSAALYYQFGIELKNVFDTQVAYALVQEQCGGEPANEQPRISLGNLCVEYGAAHNGSKDVVKLLMKRNKRYWCHRPLTRQMIEYASADVLVLPKLYEELKLEMDESLLPRFQKTCVQNVYASIQPGGCTTEPRGRSVAGEEQVSALKHKLAFVEKPFLTRREMRLILEGAIDVADDDLKDSVRELVDGVRSGATTFKRKRHRGRKEDFWNCERRPMPALKRILTGQLDGQIQHLAAVKGERSPGDMQHSQPDIQLHVHDNGEDWDMECRLNESIIEDDTNWLANNDIQSQA